MIIDSQDEAEVLRVFKLAFTYADDAKQATASKTEVLNSLAERLDKEHTKQSKKNMKKSVSKAYREWLARMQGDTTSDEADIIVSAVIKEE